MDKRSVQVPDIGDFQEVEVIDILVHSGDRIQEEDPLITLESDKASMDVPSPFSGTISSIHLKVGDKVSEGNLILELEEELINSEPTTQKSLEGKIGLNLFFFDNSLRVFLIVLLAATPPATTNGLVNSVESSSLNLFIAISVFFLSILLIVSWNDAAKLYLSCSDLILFDFLRISVFSPAKDKLHPPLFIMGCGSI